MAGLERPIYDQKIPVIDALFHHAVATGPDIEGGSGMLNTDLVQIYGLLNIVLCWARKAANHRGQKKRQL